MDREIEDKRFRRGGKNKATPVQAAGCCPLNFKYKQPLTLRALLCAGKLQEGMIQKKMKGFDFFNTWRGFEKPKTPNTNT